MASTDATPLPKKGVAYRVSFPIRDADGDLVTGATGLDSEVSKDAGTFVDCTNEATEIATASGVYYLDLTSTEMNADCVCIIVKTSSSGAKTVAIFLYPEEAGDVRVNVTAFDSIALSTDGEIPFLCLEQGTAQSLTTTALTIRAAATYADNVFNGCVVGVKGSTGATYWQYRYIVSSTGDVFTMNSVLTATPTGTLSYKIFASPASNLDTMSATIALLQTMLNGTPQFTATALALAPTTVEVPLKSGTATGGSTITVISTTNLTEADTDYWKGAMVEITSGSAAGQVRLITAFNPASDTLTVDPPFTQAVSTNTFKIWKHAPSYAPGTLTTLDALDTAQDLRHDATQTQLTTIAGYLDTEVASILANTVTIMGFIDTEISSILSQLGTIAGYIDTEVGAIKAKTDNLPATPSSENTLAALASAVGTLSGYVDTEVAAIKAVTDQFVFSQTGSVDSNVRRVNNTLVTGAGTTIDPWGP